MKLSTTQELVLHASAFRADASIREIAQLLNLREHIVRRSIQSLIDKKVYLRRSVFIDPYKIGLSIFIMQISFFGISAQQRSHYIKALCSRKGTISLAELGGEGQFELRILCKGAAALADYFEKLVEELKIRCKVVSCYQVTETEYSGRRICHTDDRVSKFFSVQSSALHEPFCQLSSNEEELLSHLANSSYMSYQELSRIIKIPLTTLTYRIQRLEERGIIVGHFYIINPKVVGELPFVIHIRSRLLTRAEKECIKVFCRQHSWITSVTFFAGEQIIELYSLVHDFAETQNIITQLSTTFGEIFESVQVLPQLEFYKYSMYPF
jgi:DNA-binding Lrp family transcriptional regulator